MACRRVTLQIVVRYSWWVRPYLCGVALTAWLTGLQPNYEKVVCTAMRGVRAQVSEVYRAN